VGTAGVTGTDLEGSQNGPTGTDSEGTDIVASELILEFEGVTTKEYFAVNKELGIDPESGEGDWPDGMVAHSAGLNDAGHLVVIEVWDTPEHQAKFMENRLGEALAKGGVTGPPSSITWIELVSHQHLGT
jgi:hypothetical protein